MPLNSSFLWAGFFLLLVIFLHFVMQRKLHDSRTITLYLLLFCSIAISLCGLVLTYFLRQGMFFHPAAQLLAVVLYLAEFSTPYLLLEFSALSCRIVTSPLLKAVRVLWCLGCLLIFSNPHTGILSVPRSDGRLLISPFYRFFVSCMLLILLADLIFVFIHRSSVRNHQTFTLAESACILFVGILLQNILHLYLFVGFSAALTASVLHFSAQSHFAYLDLTTRVFNTEYFSYCLWERLYRKTPTHMIAIYLTDFEYIRSFYGTDRELSVAIANALWRLTPSRTVFRVRSNKYAIYTSDAAIYEELLSRLQRLFDSEFEVSGRRVQCRAVLAGFKHIERSFATVEDCIGYTSFLLHHGKYRAGLRLIEDTPLLRRQYHTEKQIEHFLPAALEKDLFEVWYQPIYSVREQRFVSVEALSRLHHPDLGWIDPELMICIAMRDGHIFRLMTLQMHRICRFFQSQPKLLHTLQSIKINLTPAELSQHGYCEHLISIICSYGLPPEKFQFEVTETTATKYTPELEQCIKILQNAGIRLCLDDFGSGYANLASILRLPFSIIKIDRSLLQNIGSSSDVAVFYRSMVNTLHAKGYQIVSEGVETQKEAALLADWQVDMIQGYYYSAPLPEDKLLQTLFSPPAAS